MKSLACIRPGLFEYRNTPEPGLRSGHAKIRIRKIGICGTDLHAFEGTQPFFEYPRILGHELAGNLADADGLPGLKPWDPVTVLPYLNCGTCVACRAGKSNCCVSLKVLGVHIDGGMSEYILVPSSIVMGVPGSPMDELAMVEPMAIGRHAVSRAGLQKGEWVLVMGGGPIGLGVMTFARLAGARVIAMDRRPDRLQACFEIAGAHKVINSQEKDIGERLGSITSGDMPTTIFDATGNLEAIHSGFEYMAYGGKYVLVGLQKHTVSFSHPLFHKKEGSLLSSRNALREDFESVIRMVREGKIDPLQFITHRLDFLSLDSTFNTLFEPGNGLIKAMVDIS
jgi:2-desacetyl-2-hydroxyethyl bacteriochlorophyllide A dehydrogenase